MAVKPSWRGTSVIQENRISIIEKAIAMRSNNPFLFAFLFSLLLVNACNPSNPDPNNKMNQTRLNEPTPIVVRILDLDSISVTIHPIEIHTDTPISTPTLPLLLSTTQSPPTQDRSPTTTTTILPQCTNQAEFVKHLNITDNTVLKTGQHFAKIWRIKNVGTCTWTKDYSLVFSQGDLMSGPLSAPLPNEVNPGETIDMRLDLIAPLAPNTYAGNWMLQDPSGHLFGMGELHENPLSAIILVKPIPLPTSG